MHSFSWWQEQVGAGLPAFITQLEGIFNENEPKVLAFVPEEGRFERLRREAQLLLDQYPDPTKRPPLFGIPIGVKDIFHVDRFPTRAGSKLPATLLAGTEAPAVTALKQTGALVLGKTITTEFAYFGAGATRNPHNPAHTPGGSSSGSAASVGAGISPLTFGTQTIGSINRPAAFCGVVGYKPSFDRISKAGVIPLAESLDHVGLFAPDVAGIQHTAPLLCRNWQPTTTASQPLVLAIPDGAYLHKAKPEGLAHFERVCRQLQEDGVTIHTIPVLPNFDEIVARHMLITAVECAQTHAKWYPEFADCYHPRTAELIERGKTISPSALAKAKKEQIQLRYEVDQLMAENEISAWITPAAPGTAPLGLESTGNPVMNLPWTQCGLPTVTLPAGVNEAGLPLGIQLVGRWWQDEALLTQAKIFQQK